MISEIMALDSTNISDQIVSSLHAAALQPDPGTAQRLFSMLDGMAVTSTRDIENLRKRQAVCMWLTEMVWEYLPYDVTTQWHDFWAWCRERMNYQESSARNLIRAAATWYNPANRLPERITLYDSDGNEALDEHGGVLSVNPDIYDVPISKLVLTSAAYQEGRLTDRQLGQMLNREVSWHTVAEGLREQRLLSSGRPITRFEIDGPNLLIVEDGRIEPFGTVDIYSEDDLVRKGVRHVLLAAGIVRA
jgi:hypothetical protein